MKYLSLLIIFYSSTSIGQSLNRGIDFGVSCEEIIEIESKLGSTLITPEGEALMGFYGIHEGQEANIGYQCNTEAWLQMINYGLFERARALYELERVNLLLEKELGKPTFDFKNISWWKKLMLRLRGDDSLFLENLSQWENDTVMILTDASPIFRSRRSWEEVKDRWQIHYSISSNKPVLVNICEQGKCTEHTFKEVFGGPH